MKLSLSAGAGLALCACVTLAAPVCESLAPTAAPSAALYRALTTGAGLESAAPLRHALRALWPGFAGDADCEQEARDSGAPPGLLRQLLADGSWLIQAACAQGAYQGSTWAAQLRSPPAAPPQADLLCWPVPVERAGGLALEDRIVIWGEVTSGTAEVEVIERFRAIGDCGTRSRYRIERGRVALVGVAGALACPETARVPPAGPADWPALAIPSR
jgi:hypothetical protein